MNQRIPIQERTFQFGIRIVKMIKSLPKNPAGYAIDSQIIRSGTSIEANICEAQDAMSKANFIKVYKYIFKRSKRN